MRAHEWFAVTVVVWMSLHGWVSAVRRFDLWLWQTAQCVFGAHDWLEIVKYKQYLDFGPLINIHTTVRMYYTRRWMLCKRCMKAKKT